MEFDPTIIEQRDSVPPPPEAKKLSQFSAVSWTCNLALYLSSKRRKCGKSRG